MKIGSFELANPVIAAPMAGVTDKPYRQICRHNGAGMVVSEMLTSKAELRTTTKSMFRSDLQGEPEPVVVQLVGTEPAMLAAAAQHNVANGAQIIDINMGCPAKKVCKKAAGSALLQYPELVADILQAVVAAVAVPVTLKIRTGSDPQNRNAVQIARIAEQAGIKSLTIHGRTRQCKFVGAVEYDTIAAVKQSVAIPIVANGDISTPQEAKTVLDYTGADAVMIGRAAQGQPWLFQQVAYYLQTGKHLPAPSADRRAAIMLDHISAIHQFYGARLGVKFARKHIKWYLHHWLADQQASIDEAVRLAISTTEQADQQKQLLQQYLIESIESGSRRAA